MKLFTRTTKRMPKKHPKRNDIRSLLVQAGVTQSEIGRAIKPPVVPSRVGFAIDDPDPNSGRRIKAAVAQRLRRRITDLWPTPATETTR